MESHFPFVCQEIGIYHYFFFVIKTSKNQSYFQKKIASEIL